MLSLFLSFALSLDAKNVLVGKWSAYPGSSRSYSPQLKYTLLFTEDEFENHVYGSIWEGNKAPTESAPNPAKGALAGDVKLYFKTPDSGYYVAGTDRHWYPFTFTPLQSGKACNITTKSGHKFGVYFASEKILELTMTNPDGKIPHQYLCFFGSNINTTAAGNYVKKIHPAPAFEKIPQAANENDDDDDEYEYETNDEVEQVSQPTLSQSISTTTMIVFGSALILLQLFSCTFCMCCKICA